MKVLPERILLSTLKTIFECKISFAFLFIRLGVKAKCVADYKWQHHPVECYVPQQESWGHRGSEMDAESKVLPGRRGVEGMASMEVTISGFGQAQSIIQVMYNLSFSTQWWDFGCYSKKKSTKNHVVQNIPQKKTYGVFTSFLCRTRAIDRELQ